MRITNVTQLVHALGGSLSVAYNLNVHQITIYRWEKKNSLPRKYRTQLLELADKHGVPVRLVDKLNFVVR